MKAASASLNHPFNHPLSSRFFAALVRWFVEPSPSVVKPATRRKVRMLSAFLLFFGFMLFIGIRFVHFFDQEIWLYMVITLGLLLFAYYLSRTSFYRLAIILVIIVPAMPTFVGLLQYSPQSGNPVPVMWIVVPLLFSGLLLSIRGSIITAVLYLLVTAILVPFSSMPLKLVVELGFFILFSFVFMMAVSVLRKYDDLDLQGQLAERVRAEKTLLESEDKYRNLFDESPIGLGVSRLDGTCVQANQALLKMMGYTLEEFQQLNVADHYVNPNDRDTIIKLLEREGSLSNVTMFLKKKNGTRFYASMGLWPVLFNGEKMLQSTFMDITDRKIAQDALRKSEYELSLIFDASSDAMKLIDKDFNILRVNKSMGALDGLSDENTVGKKCYDVARSPRCHTDDCVLAMAMRSKERFSSESEITRADGSNVACLMTITPIFDRNGNVSGILEDFVDIDLRKQMEEELRALSEKEASSAREWQSLFDASVDVSTLVSPDFKFLRANQAACLAMGMSQGEIVGRKCYEIVHGLDHPIEGCPCVRSMETGKPEVSEIMSKGRHYIASAAPIYGDDGRIISFAHGLHDITERKHMEEQLRHSQVLASLGQMTAGFAHEVGNPLANIVLYSEMALQNDDDLGQTKEDLQVIYDEAGRAGKLMKDLLVYGRKVQPGTQEFDLVETLQKVIDIRRYQQKVQNIETEVKIPDYPVFIKGNPAQLTQVFINLLVNAEEALSGPGGGRIWVESHLEDGQVRVSVSDDGPGISEENMESIFHPFFTTKEVGKGTGLGLSTCYGIVVSHNGVIDVENNRFGGATFTVGLPLVKAESLHTVG